MNNIWPHYLPKQLPKCTTCNICPARPGSASCILCVDGEYCPTTVHNYVLVGYETVYSTSAEIWKCPICNHYLGIQMMAPGLMRNLLHEKLKETHNTVCSELASGRKMFL